MEVTFASLSLCRLIITPLNEYVTKTVADLFEVSPFRVSRIQRKIGVV